MSDQAANATNTSEIKRPKRRGRPPAPDTAKKRDFIDSQPADATAAEVVNAARKAGLTMSHKFVYRIREKTKNAAPKKAAGTRATPKKAAGTKKAAATRPSPTRTPTKMPAVAVPAGRPQVASRTVDQALLALALEHGIANVVGALERLRTNAAKLIASVV